ncbi:GTP-binding protein ERG-like isoform X1 [Salvia hispanica]|uniref:GTP-binding protein ERG-like isoform X1 n=1 Tax=Salvia hispanica TaxID=49212 RepID=UPI0020095B25|nr:GTP-binding protein ERG-like isoform X1 [Salvia hispanica]
MKAVRSLRRFNFSPIAAAQSPNTKKSITDSSFLRRFYSAQTQRDDFSANPDELSAQDAVFDSSQFDDLNLNPSAESSNQESTWDEKYRDRVRSQVFGENVSHLRILQREEEKKRKAGRLANELLEAALDSGESEDEEEREVTEEEQKSLAVGIIGAPNAGKSALTNYMVGTKVSAVSRKVHTTTHEVLGVMTKGDTQICFFDTPGLMLKKSGFPYNDIKVRNESAWGSVSLYNVLIVVFDVHRHITRPDSRVVRLIERMGSISIPNQKRILCMNKVDLVEKKKDLLKVVEEFNDLSGYERHFLTSGVKGAGVKDLTKYLMDQAVKRPWDEDPFTMSEELMKNISLEIVREKLLDHVHQEVPYGIEHRLMSWKELRDGSVRIEQHFITPKISQRKILVGKKGSKIGRIGIEANEELRAIFKRNVHLILMVRVK